MSTDVNLEIDAADICERLVGITPIYLQNFLTRDLYGLRSSIKSGKVRAQRRLFSREDVFGIALVWLLFESGLRGEPLTRILNDLAEIKKVDANRAAERLLAAGADYLLVIRKARRPSKSIPEKPDQKVAMVKKDELSSFLDQFSDAGILIIPVGAKFADVRLRLDVLFDFRTQGEKENVPLQAR